MTADSPLDRKPAAARSARTAHLDEATLAQGHAGRLTPVRAVDAVLAAIGNHSTSACPACRVALAQEPRP